MLGKVFNAFGVRAIHPKPLSAKIAWQVGYGAAQYLTKEADDAGYDEPMMRHIVVGRDMRKSSPELCDALKQGIKDFGASVIDLGLVDTPFIYFAINYLGCCGGVQTTASHRSARENGFEISKIGARPVSMLTGLEEIRRSAAMASADKVVPAGGREEQRDLWDAYREHVHEFIDPCLHDGSRKLKVVVDASNGLAGTMVPKIFDGVAGLEILPLNFDHSGDFAHEPNPRVEANLESLRALVREEKADAGICFDGDADRCVIVDERGEVIGCDHLTAWLATRFLKLDPGSSIVYDLRSSRAVAEIIKESGGKPIRSRVGHAHMMDNMIEHKAIFGGELSGHYYFRDNFCADSGAITLACVVSALATSDGRLSAQVAPARRYVQSGEISFETEDKEMAIDDLKRAFADAEIEEVDGVTLRQNGWWCNIRSAIADPLLHLNVEASDVETVDRLVEDISRYLGTRVR